MFSVLHSHPKKPVSLCLFNNQCMDCGSRQEIKNTWASWSGNRNLGKQKLMIQIGNRPGHWGLTPSHYEKSHEISDDLERLAFLFVRTFVRLLYDSIKNTQDLIMLNCVSTSECDRNYLSFHSVVKQLILGPEIVKWNELLGWNAIFLCKCQNLQYFLNLSSQIFPNFTVWEDILSYPSQSSVLPFLRSLCSLLTLAIVCTLWGQ